MVCVLYGFFFTVAVLKKFVKMFTINNLTVQNKRIVEKFGPEKIIVQLPNKGSYRAKTWPKKIIAHVRLFGTQEYGPNMQTIKQ